MSWHIKLKCRKLSFHETLALEILHWTANVVNENRNPLTLQILTLGFRWFLTKEIILIL